MATATFNTTAETPDAGTPPTPSTLMVNGLLGPIRLSGLPWARLVLHWVAPATRPEGLDPRVSQIRAGVARAL